MHMVVMPGLSWLDPAIHAPQYGRAGCCGCPDQVGSSPGMTTLRKFNTLRHGRACPGHPRTLPERNRFALGRVFPQPAKRPGHVGESSAILGAQTNLHGSVPKFLKESSLEC